LFLPPFLGLILPLSCSERIGETSFRLSRLPVQKLGIDFWYDLFNLSPVYFAFVFPVFLVLLLSAIRFLAMNVGISASFQTYVDFPVDSSMVFVSSPVSQPFDMLFNYQKIHHVCCPYKNNPTSDIP
jgi:hypothetical protein